MAMIDWFLARSQTLRILLSSIRDHKISTQQSFSKVKEHHKKLAKQIVNHEIKIRELEERMQDLMPETETIIIKKRKD